MPTVLALLGMVALVMAADEVFEPVGDCFHDGAGGLALLDGCIEMARSNETPGFHA